MGIEVLRVARWSAHPWLAHGFSTRSSGVSTVYGGRTLNLGWTKEDAREAVVENRRLLVEAAGGKSANGLITLKQVHGTAIRVVGAVEEMQSVVGRALYEGDGLMTAAPDVLLGIQTADCVPVMIVDEKRRAVAVLHAGWRGTASGIAALAVARMRAEFGSRVEDLTAAVGPSIGPCCYEVGEEVRAAFHAGFVYGSELFHGGGLDLWEANRRQLVNTGVKAKAVAMIEECTSCARTASGERRYFSHRAEHGMTGRMMSVVGVRSGT